MIMADQDHDGSHIKGLVINLISYFWPELTKLAGFLKEFVTPIVKARKDKQEKAFFTLNEFINWAEHEHGWNFKYYKGLGTSTAAEAKEYFKQIKKHEITFKYKGPQDFDAIELAFAKKNADRRKE